MPKPSSEPKSQIASPHWAWIIAGVVLVTMIWWILSESRARTRLAQPTPQERVAGERQELARQGNQSSLEALPIRAMRSNPDQYLNQEVRGTATVAKVISDRAFWLEEDGRMVVTVLGPGLPASNVRLQTGQRVAIEGVFQGRNALQQVPQLDPEAHQILETQPGFIRANLIDILEPKTPSK